LFVAATLYSDSGSAPVNIRNLSHSGALIEGAVLPDVGTGIALKRGQLHAAGRIAWRSDRRAGLSLDAFVHIADWMSRTGTAGQQRVDAEVASIKEQAAAGGKLAETASNPASVEMELTQLRAELGALENALIADVILVATHPEIQMLDIACQRIDRVLRHLRGEG
jgi:hypothetical protein